MKIPMEDWLRGCVYHDGRHGEVTLSTDKVLEIADYIQLTRVSIADGMIELPPYEPKDDPQFDKDINVRSKDETKTQMKTQNSNKNSNVISVYDGVSEAVRCAMCNNPNKSDRGCDGACSYDEALYKKIIDAIHNCQYEPKDEPQTDGNDYRL